jgi:hypothetical protein
MENFNLHVLADAKLEYTKQLVNLLTPRILEGIRSIYDVAVDLCDRHEDDQYLKKFQTLLGQIPKWNSEIIEKEYLRIEKRSDCDWLDELIGAVFVAHTKVLTAIKIKKNKVPMDIQIPEATDFIHKCYIEVARQFWKKPYLLYHKLPKLELQRNLGETERVIQEAIEETIRKQLPVRTILKEYLGKDYTDDDCNEEDIASAISFSSKNNLRKLVKQEIENSLKEHSYHSLEQTGGREELLDIPKEEQREEPKEEQREELEEEPRDLELEISSKVEEPLEEKPVENTTKIIEIGNKVEEESRHSIKEVGPNVKVIEINKEQEEENIDDLLNEVDEVVSKDGSEQDLMISSEDFEFFFPDAAN